MIALRDAAEDYLRMRRALGYKLEIQGLLLRGFVSYLDEIDAATVTIENAVAWATAPAGADPAYVRRSWSRSAAPGCARAASITCSLGWSRPLA